MRGRRRRLALPARPLWLTTPALVYNRAQATIPRGAIIVSRSSDKPRPSKIAIDGPAASGKSAVGTRVAQALSYRFVDTGAMYRAITWHALRSGVDPNDPPALAALARSATFEVEAVAPGEVLQRVIVNGDDATPHLREPHVEAAVSLVSRVPSVREAMVAIQRRLAEPGRIVMAGRDIGSVVLPDAALKIYLEASLEVRAARRRLEMASSDEAIQSGMAERDRIDSSRKVSPLKPAPGAIVIKTDNLSLDEVVERILSYCR